MKTWSRVSIAVLSLMIVAGWSFVARAQSVVDINLPSDPAPVVKTTLATTAMFDTTSITVPATATLTVVVTNTGPVTAQHLALEQHLPPGITVITSPTVSLDDLGALSSGESLKLSWSLRFTDALVTDRYTFEHIFTGANVDPTEGDASIDVTNGTVLGATDSTLAETGNNPMGFIIIGLALLMIGGLTMKRASQVEK